MENSGEFVEERFFLFGGEFVAFLFGEGGGDGGDGVHGGEFVLEVLAEVFAEDSADAIADGRASDVFFGDDESESGSSAFFAAAVCFDSGPFDFSSAFGGELEVFAFSEEAFGGQGSADRCGGKKKGGGGRGRGGWELGGEADSAFAAPGVEDGAAMSGGHAGAESMSAFAADV